MHYKTKLQKYHIISLLKRTSDYKTQASYIYDLPGMIGVLSFPCLRPFGKDKWTSSPTTRPNAAPILKTGMKLPEGTGIVEHTMEKNHWKNSTTYNKCETSLLIGSGFP